MRGCREGNFYILKKGWGKGCLKFAIGILKLLQRGRWSADAGHFVTSNMRRTPGISQIARVSH